MNTPCRLAFSAITLVCSLTASSAIGTVYDVPPDSIPQSLNSGDVINLRVAGVLSAGFELPADTTLNVNGGVLSDTYDNVKAYGEVNFYDSPISNYVTCYEPSSLNVFGGELAMVSAAGAHIDLDGGYISLLEGSWNTIGVRSGTLGSLWIHDSHLVIDGGEVRSIDFPHKLHAEINDGILKGLYEATDTTIDMKGGTLTNVFLHDSCTINLSGGSFPSEISMVYPTSALNITGTSFLLDGEPIEGLTAGQTVTINERDVVLSGTLLDGSDLNFTIENWDEGGTGVADVTTVTVTLVPEPAAIGLLTMAAQCWLIRRRAWNHCR